jgi:glycosyltransferase involved in cell wall biosynthesis
LIAWADYLVLPSRIESIPVIFSDAMKIGTPMIATPVGDMPRLYDDYRFGVMAVSPNSGAIADAIRRACDSSPQQYTTGIARAARDFDLTKIVDQFLLEAGVNENG